MFRLANLQTQLQLYEGCGNMLGIVPLSLSNYPDNRDFNSDQELRAILAGWGWSTNSDSVMVLTGDPLKHEDQGYHFEMSVFEPRGNDNSGMAGGFSTMCGNGIRAVAAYTLSHLPNTQEVRVKTQSGVRVVEIINNEYKVNMGQLITSRKDLSRYINQNVFEPEDLFKVCAPEQLTQQGLDYINTISIGLTGNYNEDGDIDGEPHTVMMLDSNINQIKKLRELAVKLGPRITKNLTVFPQEVNANFVIITEVNDKSKTIEALIVTHERNLGDDPEHSVTEACGTGATVTGGLILRQLNKPDYQVRLTSRGEVLTINQQGEELFMTGPANPVS